MTSHAAVPPIGAVNPRESGGVDLSNCDREAIHIPGSVQPHGVLLVLDAAGDTIRGASENTGALLGADAAGLLGAPLDRLLTPEAAAAVRDACAAGDDVEGGNPHGLALAAGSTWNGMLHRHDGRTLLELEPRRPGDLSYRECFDHLRRLTARLQASRTLLDAFAATVAEVRRLTRFDQVLIYRFLPDAAGQVVAEDRADDMPAYLGLHFPASDIPAQARALYARNPLRLIADAAYAPAPLLLHADEAAGGPVDLSFAALRSISPVHREYLGNMGVRASMSASIMRDGRLWGLLSCMDRQARPVSFETRQACELMAQALAWQIGVLEEMEAAQHGLRVRTLQTRLAVDLGTARDAHRAIAANGEAMLEAVSATGAVLCVGRTVTEAGAVPGGETLGALRAWLASRHGGEVFSTDQLGAHWPPGRDIEPVASGILAVPLARGGADMILWLRPELKQTVRWGGDPHKAATPDRESGRIHPRKSFAAWTEQVQGRSAPWEGGDVAAAMSFRDLAIDAIVRRSEELAESHQAMEESRDQLETFVQIASHDLLEPARQIETLTDILHGVLPADLHGEPGLGEVFAGIRGVSGRLRQMVTDLSDYSRVGRGSEPFEPVDLDEVVAAVAADLRPLLDEAGVRLHAESLPSVVCDRRQIRHVLLNLIGNAIKYRAPDRPPEIRVSGTSAPEAGDGQGSSNQPGDRTVSICVTDNGIGFDARHRERIFEPFLRLHGQATYEGTGVGLAICRKIVERHGGTIAAEGRPGEGSCFTFTLPMRGLYPVGA